MTESDRDQLAALTAKHSRASIPAWAGVLRDIEAEGYTIVPLAAPSPDLAALRVDPYVYVWLIERGQQEGLARPKWWGVTDSRTGAYGWVDSAFAADQFGSRAEAEEVIARFDRPGHPFHARAVEHGFRSALAASPPPAKGSVPADQKPDAERLITLDAAWAVVEEMAGERPVDLVGITIAGGRWYTASVYADLEEYASENPDEQAQAITPVAALLALAAQMAAP